MTNTTASERPQPTATTRKPRRMARQPQADAPADDTTSKEPKPASAPKPNKAPKSGKRPNPGKAPSKLDQVESLVLAPTGASIAELVAATGWQQHSVRGAMAGALKKRGLAITSDKVDGVRRYRAEKPA